MWQAQQITAIQLANQLLYSMSAPSGYALNQRPPHLDQSPIEDNGGDTDDENAEQFRTLYVGNLDDRVTEELLYEIFLQAGPLETIRIPKDNGGRQRSFGFVVYSNRCTPSYAVKLFAGLTLYRKTLIIKLQADPNASRNRRSLPTDCERYITRPSDNSMLRSTSYPSFHDPGMNDNDISSQFFNPFRTNSPDCTRATTSRSRERGSRDRERDMDFDRDRMPVHSNTRSRPHPYRREERRQHAESRRQHAESRRQRR